MQLLMKLKSKVGKANTINDSLRVIIPQNVKQILQLEAGDTLEWNINSENDKIIVTIEKSKE
ncbi:AbrB/MazE/SpoVT family DNA-binding domain-containing protein [Methanobrevibacter ruminantium]|uniref:AbrB/MazE/SpoVT family DNA-binding domain-containing protein n=1 Tax=Methanobrevibacter ruminantium TaxID=83816 RepID=UPI0026EDC3AA|nr:AbrB/MazE/SpoVT family DNA-binding domain-containing protein [Methanobrevibacter ruminantium]